jgi:uncharacterized protein
MKLRYIYQSVLFIIGLFFILLGFVGLLLPIAPQVPFFIIGAICLMKSSNRIRDCVKQKALSKIYRKIEIIKANTWLVLAF